MSTLTNKPFFHYPKNHRGESLRQVVAVIFEDGRTFHGVSICHPDDEFNKKSGRELALTRAIESWEKWKNNQSKNVASAENVPWITHFIETGCTCCQYPCTGNPKAVAKPKKEKVKVAHYNISNSKTSPYGLSTKIHSHKTNDTCFTIHTSNKNGDTWCKDNDLLLTWSDNGDGVTISFDDIQEHIRLDYSQIAHLEMALWKQDQLSNKLNKFRPKRVKS